MISKSSKAELDLRGLTLVVGGCAWLAGIRLNSLLPPLVLLPGACAALILLILLRHDSQGRLVMLLILGLLLGAWRYSTVSPVGDPQAISAFIGPGKVEVRGTVADEPTLEAKTDLLRIDVSSISKNGGSSWQNAHGQLEVQILDSSFYNPYGPNYGDNVELQGKLQYPPPYSTPNIFASMAFPRISVKSSGGNPFIALIYQLRIRLATIILQSLPQPKAALLIGILLGLRLPALRALLSIFSETGTVHLTVSSGFKVTIVAGLVKTCTRWLYEEHEQQGRLLLPAEKRKRNWRRWLATSLVILSIVIYTFLNGAGPAAIRAGIMGILLVVAPRLGRVYNVYTALAFAALVMSLLDPFVLWDVGFQLSFVGTLGIVLMTPLFQHLLHPLERLPLGYYIAEIIAVTLAAEVATWPIVALVFHVISFIAPLTNLLTVPLLGLLVVIGLLVCGGGLLFAQLGIVIGWVALPLLRYVLTIIKRCAEVPGAYMPYLDSGACLAWGYYTLLAIILSIIFYKWPALRERREAAASPLFSRPVWRLIQLGAALVFILATGAAALAAQPDGRCTVTFLSVGPARQAGQAPQGEAILLHTPDGKFALIDGGLDAASLSQKLDNRLPFWQRSLDMVLLTTPRQDHLNGLQDVVTRYQIGEVLDAGMLHPNTGYALWRRTITDRNLPYQQVHEGMTVPLGTQLQFQVLWPSPQLHQGSNEELDNAMIVRIVTPDRSILLLGTAALSKYALNGILTTINPHFLQADIVQIVGEIGKTFPSELRSILQIAHPSRLVITPAALSAKKRKAGEISTVLDPLPPMLDGGSWQVLQTAQGTIELSADKNGWNIQPIQSG